MQPRIRRVRTVCEGIAKRLRQSNQGTVRAALRQWLFLAKQAEAERFNRRTLIVRDPVLFVRCVRDSEVTPHALWDRRNEFGASSSHKGATAALVDDHPIVCLC